MAFALLDDGFCDHPKVVAAEAIHDRAPWLFTCGLLYCRRYLTRGLIPTSMVPTLVRGYKSAMKDALVAVDLWIVSDAGVLVHDYDDWNAGEEQQREARKEKAKAAAEARWGTKK